MLGPYREFIVADDEVFPDSLPTHVRLIDDDQRLTPVDLEAMSLTLTGGDQRTFGLKAIGDLLVPATAEIFYAVVLHALDGNRKASTVHLWCGRIGRMIKRLRPAHKIACFTLPMFLKESQTSSPNELKSLRAFLKYWIDLGYPGIAADLKTHIQVSKSPKTPSPFEIQARKEHERPFSIETSRSIRRQVDDLYISGDFDPQINLLWRLIISEGLRTSQMQLIRVKDVNLSAQTLLIALVKQHGKPARSNMREVHVSTSIQTALRDHLAWMREVSGQEADPEQPLFCVNTNMRSPVIQKRALNIRGLIVRSRVLITKHIAELRDLDLFARRFKHTKLTHLALLGAPLEVLVYAAFQTTPGSVTRYVNMNSDTQDAYERLMDPLLTEIDDSFRGKVLAANQAAEVPKEKLILTAALDDKLGGCGSNLCSVLAPHGCYICPRFNAFLDGPHDEELAIMEAAREGKLKMGLPPETVRRDDEIISAIRSVIKICDERRRSEV